MVDLVHLKTTFVSRYGKQPRIFRAPGRINLIGEHTDYNGGFVLPAAIGLATYVAIAQRDDRRIKASSMNFSNELDLNLDHKGDSLTTDWSVYIAGVALTLEAHGYRFSGADIMIDSDIPVGAGLSSSAALEIATAFALADVSGQSVDGLELAKIGQAAENQFAGVGCGIMDQFTSVFGVSDHALFLDCRSMEWQRVPVSGAEFIVCNTMTKHDLAEGEYNRRRSECEAAAKFFGKSLLRDVSVAEFNTREQQMPETIRRRARHVITENQRVIDSVDALKNGDLRTFGRLIDASHESLRKDFEVSCDELDLMVDLARGESGVLGSRMIGGGFGGCALIVAEPGDHSVMIKNIADHYKARTGLFPDIFICTPSAGVAEIGLTN